MPYTDCPECGDTFTESTGTEINSGEAYHQFECSKCNYQWHKLICKSNSLFVETGR